MGNYSFLTSAIVSSILLFSGATAIYGHPQMEIPKAGGQIIPAGQIQIPAAQDSEDVSAEATEEKVDQQPSVVGKYVIPGANYAGSVINAYAFAVAGATFLKNSEHTKDFIDVRNPFGDLSGCGVTDKNASMALLVTALHVINNYFSIHNNPSRSTLDENRRTVALNLGLAAFTAVGYSFVPGGWVVGALLAGVNVATAAYTYVSKPITEAELEKIKVENNIKLEQLEKANKNKSELKQLERQMREAAGRLDFEQAIALRNEWQNLKDNSSH
jgi:hypothetical protein